MRSALAACFRKNLVSFTMVRPPQTRPVESPRPPGERDGGKFVLERRCQHPDAKSKLITGLTGLESEVPALIVGMHPNVGRGLPLFRARACFGGTGIAPERFNRCPGFILTS
jgi:hypothetical protein